MPAKKKAAKKKGRRRPRRLTRRDVARMTDEELVRRRTEIQAALRDREFTGDLDEG